MKRILVIHDDLPFLHFLVQELHYRGFEVNATPSGREAVATITEFLPDLVILDLLLADESGLAVCRHIREEGYTTLPILILTTRNELDAKIAALDSGADDYITRPFAFDELIARVRAALRRVEGIPHLTEQIHIGDLFLDTGSRRVWRNGRLVDLTRREYDLLELLAENAGRVLTKSRIFERVWGYDNHAGLEVIKVYVNYIRAKLNRDNQPDLIHAVRGIGYVLRPEESKSAVALPICGEESSDYPLVTPQELTQPSMLAY